jgi:hypothetical protein
MNINLSRRKLGVLLAAFGASASALETTASAAAGQSRLQGEDVAAGTPRPRFAKQKGGLDQTGPYKVVDNWFKPGVDGWYQPVTAVAIDTPDRIIIGMMTDGLDNSNLLSADGKIMAERHKQIQPRGSAPRKNMIMALNGNGEVIERDVWSKWDPEIAMAHNMQFDPYDPARPLWVMNRTDHTIMKLSRDGKKLLMTVGTKGEPGWGPNHFNQPTAIAILPDGSFYISDGYVNRRIAKFDKNGKFLLEWGNGKDGPKDASGPGQFSGWVHGVAVDAKGRVYAADRGNGRVQVFTGDGKFIEEWPNLGMPLKLIATKDGNMLMLEEKYERVAKLSLEGQLLDFWGTKGAEPGQFDAPHDMAVDDAGNFYVAEAWNNRVEKFAPDPNADQSRLFTKPFTSK